MQLVLHQEDWLRLVGRSLLVGRSCPLQGFPQPVLHQEGWLRLAYRLLIFFKKQAKVSAHLCPRLLHKVY